MRNLVLYPNQGLGKRLEELTSDRIKSMLEVGGRTLFHIFVI